ncbi:hypothetical protein EKG37_16115 [Robertmurraya yapensis]|uniref:YfjL-like N-terminal domain-containing protein n=1 Tax=Bacillus yapensis TaxID=2492960 RepID=A0A3S0IPN8_9BACI|nr:hypothetical protein [Bacillus yapensis]RTR28743.1 hypothetical protein EKG37_16115 [Bacillus yapensis]TKS94600.1 hypothetical protein FAR12_16115 [Bacillus yapensis]
MSMSIKKFFVVVSIVLFGVFLFFYITFAGLPWKKWFIGNEALAYLENKYKEEFVIEDRYYNFKDAKYSITAHPLKNPSISFNAGEAGIKNEYFDYYPEAIWTMQAEGDFKDIVKETFPNLRRYNVNTVFGEGDKLVYQTKIPDYITAKAFVDILVILPDKFVESNAEYKKMLSLINFVREKDGNIHIFIAYEPNEDYASDTVYFTFSNAEIHKIKTIEDVEKYGTNLE